MSKLPSEDRPMRIDPDLAAALEKALAPYSGERLEKAQAAVREVRSSAAVGTFGEVLDRYRSAIREAVAG